MKQDNLVPTNLNILDGVDDLVQLSYLNELSVLYDIQIKTMIILFNF